MRICSCSCSSSWQLSVLGIVACFTIVVYGAMQSADMSTMLDLGCSSFAVRQHVAAMEWQLLGGSCFWRGPPGFAGVVYRFVCVSRGLQPICWCRAGAAWWQAACEEWQCRVCCRVHTTVGGLIMVIALGGRAGVGVALRANVRGGPAWWVFRAGFVGRQAGFMRVLLRGAEDWQAGGWKVGTG